MTDFKKLAESSRISDKIKAAQDISCPAVIIDQIVLASDISWDSEYGKMLMDAISRNPNCSSEHLRYIFENTTEVLQLNVLQNPACPVELLDQVLAGSNSNLIQIALQHPDYRKRNKEHWRTRLRRLGKEFFEVDDMVRLGFIELDGLENIEESYQELTSLKKWKKELHGRLDDFEVMLKKVHSLRMERIRKEREKRKKEKEAERKAAREKEILRKKTAPTYLGDGVSKGLEYDSIRKDELKKTRLPIINNAGDLAKKIGITSEELAWLCYHRKASTIDHYSHFTIPKRKGGSRTISSPKPLLRQAQRWVLEKILSKVKVNSAATGFISGKSIVDNAKVHQRKKIILKMDLKDFFPSIKFNRVKGMFHSFGYSEGTATILALITTESERKEVVFNGKKYFIALDDRRLPQGACTSPAVSNIISRKMDSRMHGLGVKMGWSYTRYADDIVFSTDDNTASATAMIKTTMRIIFEEGFTVNDAKTAVMRPHQRQVVTGIVVNDELKISRRDMRNYRAFLHQYKKIGKVKMTKKLGRNADAYAKGYLSYINMVSKQQADKITSGYPWLSKL
jgi:retron-type reverse transcriptase/predicted SprT family Zn-dependent metalloprotease